MKHVPLLALRLLCMCLLGVLGSCGSSETDGVELETVVTIEEGSNVSYRLAAGTKYASITSDRNGVTISWPCGLAVETRSYGASCYFPQDDVLRIYNPVNEVSGGPETVRVLVIRK